MTEKDAYIIAQNIAQKYMDKFTETDIDAFTDVLALLKEKADVDDSKQYIRFGDFPEDKISKAHRGDAITKVEEGLSVWNCAFVNDVPFPLLPENASESAMADYFYMLLGDKPVYLVSGTELESVGSAGEPLLGTDAHIVRDYTEDYKYLKDIHTRNKEDYKDPGLESLHWRYIIDENDHPCDGGDRLVAYYDKDGCRRLGDGYYTLGNGKWNIWFGNSWEVWDRVYAWADLPIIDDFLTCDAPNPKNPSKNPITRSLNIGKYFTVNLHSDVEIGDEIVNDAGSKGIIVDIKNERKSVIWTIFFKRGRWRFMIGDMKDGDKYALTGKFYYNLTMQDLIAYGNEEDVYTEVDP
jgi:hypothetical protein